MSRLRRVTAAVAGLFLAVALVAGRANRPRDTDRCMQCDTSVRLGSEEGP